MTQFETTAGIIERLQREVEEHGEGAVVNNKSRLIIHDGRDVYILHKPSGQVEIANYSPKLYYVMCCPSLCEYSYDYRKGRMLIEINAKQKNGKRWKVILGRFIYLWIKNDRPVNDFLHDMPILPELSVDHVNGDKTNHSSWNLMGLSKAENNRKGTRPLRVKPPYYCYTVVDEQGKYRVCFGYENLWWQGQEMLFICDSVDQLVDLYRAIMNISHAPCFLRRGETPLAFWKADKKGLTAVENWAKSRKYTDFLLWLDESELEKWEVGNTIDAKKVRL